MNTHKDKGIKIGSVVKVKVGRPRSGEIGEVIGSEYVSVLGYRMWKVKFESNGTEMGLYSNDALKLILDY